MPDTIDFFIIGAQRSGTTLLRLMLNAHPRVAVPEEGTFWIPLLRRHRSRPNAPIPPGLKASYMRYLERNVQFRNWGLPLDAVPTGRDVSAPEFMASFYRVYAAGRGKAIVGDKTPRFFDKVGDLNTFYPTARFIHIVRDGRDTYASQRRMGYRANPAVAALEWRCKVDWARRQLAALDPSRSRELRYEDLVARPEECMQDICALLGLEYDSAMLDFWRDSALFIGKHHSRFIFRPVSQDNVGKWKKSMGEREVVLFDAVAGERLRELGYETGPAPTAAQRLMTGGALAVGLPLRAAKVIRTAVTLQLASRFGLATVASGMGVRPEAADGKPADGHSGEGQDGRTSGRD